MFDTLQDFVAALDASGELVRVRAQVDPVLEIAGIADRLSKLPAPNLPSAATRATDPRFSHLGGPAVLFENVAGSNIPVLINAFGSYRRMELALGLHEALLGVGEAAARGYTPGHTPGGFEALAAKIAALVKPEPPRNLSELVAKAKQFAPLLKIPPKRRSGHGRCQEVVLTGNAIDLTKLPLIRCWPMDGDFVGLGYPPDVNDGIEGLGKGDGWRTRFQGRYITLAGIHTVHAEDRDAKAPASHNIGMYRVQLLGPQRLAMHWHMHHDGARHWRSWKALGKPMPVAIALGGESVLAYAATAPLPPGLSELLLAGFLHRRGIEMVRGKTVPLWVPANAEIVIEGYVSEKAGFIGYDPRRDGPVGDGAVFEGPFGDHTGFYSLPDRYPILTVTAITMQRAPIYPTTVVGLPPQEDYFLGKATERIFLPLLRTLLPDIEDYDLPMFGAFHNAAVLRIRKSYPLHGRRVMHGVWGAGQMAWTKTIFVVDDDINPHDTAQVFAQAAAHCDPGRDIEQVWGPLDILDHAAPRLGAGMKVGFDCTRKIKGEEAGSQSIAAREAASDAALEALAAHVRTLEGVAGTGFAFGLRQWLLVQLAREHVGRGGEIIEALQAAVGLGEHVLPAFVILLGPDARIMDTDAALFHWMAHSDASRDWVRVKAGSRVTLVIDATPKMEGEVINGQPVRGWPPVLGMPGELVRQLDARWAAYGFSPAEQMRGG